MRHLRIFESYQEQLQEATPPTSASPTQQSKEAAAVNRMANFFNKFYKLNLKLDGNPKNPEYMKAFTRFCQEHKITTWTCKKGDGYCSDAQAGMITIKDEKSRAIFDKIVKTKALELLMKP
jgi:hypothetical protein